MTEFQILSAVKNNGGSIEYTALINLNISDVNRDGLADKARIEQMLNKGLLKGKADAYCHISISDEGRLYLQDACNLEDQNKKLAEDVTRNKAKKKRHDWQLAIGGAFIAGLIGLAFELIAFFLLK